MTQTRPYTPLADRLDQISSAWTEAVDSISAHRAARDGIVKAALIDLIWSAFYDLSGERHAIADALEGMDGAIRRAAAGEHREGDA